MGAGGTNPRLSSGAAIESFYHYLFALIQKTPFYKTHWWAVEGIGELLLDLREYRVFNSYV